MALLVIVLGMISACANVPRSRDFEQLAKAEVIGLDGLSKRPAQALRLGYESKLDFQPAAILTENGPSRFALAELPQREDSAVITLRSHAVTPVYAGTAPDIFAPQFQLLDQDFQPIPAVFDPPKWRWSYSAGSFYELDILVEPQARYLLVYTDPAMVSTHVALQPSVQAAEQHPAFHIVVPRHAWRREPYYLPSGDVDVRVPGCDDYRFVHRNPGFSIDIGASFGGAELADATEGDDIEAGSGVIAYANYNWPLAGSGRWGIMGGVGMLYANAKVTEGRVRMDAWSADLAGVYTGNHWRTRLGMTADFSPTFESPAGKRHFNDAFGPLLVLEFRAAEKVWIGLRYEDLDYKDRRTGETLDASNFGVTVNASF